MVCLLYTSRCVYEPVIADTISKTGIVWQTDYNEDESNKDSDSMDNHDDYNPDLEIVEMCIRDRYRTMLRRM